MAFSQQEMEMLFASAQQNYLFKFAFESRNPGCEFDIDSWMKDLNESVPQDSLNIMNKETAVKLASVLNNLDKYAIPVEKTNGLKLV